MVRRALTVLVLAVFIGIMASVSLHAGPVKEFNSIPRAKEFLRERLKCTTVECLNQHIDRLETLVEDLFVEEYVCTELGQSEDASGKPLLVYTC